MNTSTKYYLSLFVYDYDASPRGRLVKITFITAEEAIREADTLKVMIGNMVSDNRTSGWLIEKMGISGFVECVYGVYQEETTKIA